MSRTEIDKAALELFIAIDDAANLLPGGKIISIEIEKDGYGVYLKEGYSKKALDGGEGMSSCIREGIEKANEDVKQ